MAYKYFVYGLLSDVVPEEDVLNNLGHDAPPVSHTTARPHHSLTDTAILDASQLTWLTPELLELCCLHTQEPTGVMHVCVIMETGKILNSHKMH